MKIQHFLFVLLTAALAIGAPAARPPALPDDPECTAGDRLHMARAYELARLAVRNGGGPFGALLVVDGRVAAEFGNCAAVTRDVTKHAETGLISAFGAGLGRAAFSRGTLYTSSEPCTMCCGAIRFAGIKRVVYGTTEEQFVRVIGTPDSEQPLNSREIFRRTAPDVKVLGPLMEEEGLRIHEAFWPARLTERSE